MVGQPVREKVLVVDEDVDVLDLLGRQVLTPLGFTVATAETAGDAIGRALTLRPDLIVASLTLPGLSGKDLLVALRSQGLHMPVLVTANEGREADAVQAFRLGGRGYLGKPLREGGGGAAGGGGLPGGGCRGPPPWLGMARWSPRRPNKGRLSPRWRRAACM